MVQWPISEPRLLPISAVIQMEVANTIRQKNFVMIETVAEKLFRHYIMKNITSREIIQAVINVAWTIDGFKVKKFGYNYATDISNHIVGRVISKAVGFANFTGEDMKYLNRLKDQLLDHPQFSWFYPKILNMADAIKLKIKTMMWADGLSNPYATRMYDIMNVQIADLQTQIGDMMKDLVNLRKYGVKACFFQDGVLHSPLEAWIYMDYRDFVGSASREAMVDKIPNIALVALAPKHEITTFKVRHDSISKADWLMKGVKMDIPTYFHWVIDKSGHLNISTTYGNIPLSEMFASVGKEIEYEIVRLALLTRLYDLVVPLTTVSKMPKLPTQTGFVQGAVSAMMPDFIKKKLVTPDIIIPRLRALENNLRHIVEESEVENDRADSETKRRALHREHGVINHIRQLPEGHHPSGKAKAAAKEDLGIDLKTNETYIRKHSRGKGQLIDVQRARQKQPA